MPRHLDELVVVRFPGLFRLLARRVHALPPGSPFRRRMLKHAVSRGWEATARGDETIVRLAFSPAVEIHVVGFDAVGLSEHYQGHDALGAAIQDVLAAVGSSEVVPELLIDRGDRFVVRMRAVLRGKQSGAEVAGAFGMGYEVDRGIVMRGHLYRDWSHLVEAFGMASEPPTSVRA
jgi:hypothetical protein